MTKLYQLCAKATCSVVLLVVVGYFLFGFYYDCYAVIILVSSTQVHSV